MNRALVPLLAGAAFSVAVGAQSPSSSRSAPMFEAYWKADSAAKAAHAADAIVASTPDFDDVWTRLKAGRTYRAEPAGIRKLDTVVNSTFLDNTLAVPDGYDPA